MHTKLLLIFAFAAVVSSHDISIGSETVGRKIFDEIRQANPAIWRQIENVTIIAPNDEIISRVVVTDMRPEKDGDVQIVDGGDGKKSVTLELKSPTVLRGYEFHLEIYSAPETKLTDAEEGLSVPTSMTDKIDVLPETSEAKSHETDGSGDEVEDTEMPNDTDKTTELPESSTNRDIPALVGKVVDGDILRPARETSDENLEISKSEENFNLNPSVIGSETDLSTTENVKTEMEEITTEADVTTKLNESDESTETPLSFDNSKNIPDYPALSILDLIKSKEGTRQYRRTDDESNESNNDATTTEQLVENKENVDISYMLPTEEPSSSSQNNNDDTVDLVPPEETDYNTGFFSNDEGTEKPFEISTTIYDRPRAGRGLDLADTEELFTTTTVSTIESTTSLINDEENKNSTTETTIDEQLRDTRDARKDVEDFNGLDSAIDSNQNEQIPLCRTVPNENDNPSNNLTPNIIVVNGEQLTLSPDSNHKLQFGIPIVLIIGSETNIPTIKIIAEGTTNDSQNVNQFSPAESSLEDNGPVPEDRLTSQEKDEVSDDEFILKPQPVMNFE